MLLTEFDPARDTVINPDMIHQKMPDFPETLVSVFSHQLFNAVLEFLGGKVIAETGDVDGNWPLNWHAKSRAIDKHYEVRK